MTFLPVLFHSYLRELTWLDNTRSANRVNEYNAGDDVNLTTLLISKANKCLIAGLQNGNIRVYEWPLSGLFTEYPAHRSMVTAVRMSHDNMRLITAGDDGSMMVFGIQKVEHGIDVPFIEEESAAAHMEFSLVAQEELMDRQQELTELRKLYEDLKSDSEYNLHRKDAEWSAEMKSAGEVGE